MIKLSWSRHIDHYDHHNWSLWHHNYDVKTGAARWWHHVITIMIHDDVIITLQSVIMSSSSWLWSPWSWCQHHWLQGDDDMWSTSWFMMMSSSPCSQWSWHHHSCDHHHDDVKHHDCKVMTSCDHNHDSWWCHHHLAVSNLMSWSHCDHNDHDMTLLTARWWHHVITIMIHDDVIITLQSRIPWHDQKWSLWSLHKWSRSKGIVIIFSDITLQSRISQLWSLMSHDSCDLSMKVVAVGNISKTVDPVSKTV